MLSKHIDDSRRRSTEPGECIQYRQIGFARAIMLQALATSGQDFLRIHSLVEEGFDQRRLSDPNFTRNKDDLTFPRNRTVHRVAHFLQLELPPKESDRCRLRMNGPPALKVLTVNIS